MAFTGSPGGACRARAPMLLPVVVLLAAFAQPMAPDDEPPWYLALAMLAVAVLWPWVRLRVKRYQHAHDHWVGQTTQLDAGLGALYVLAWRAGLVALLPVLALVGLAWVPPSVDAQLGNAGLAQFEGEMLAPTQRSMRMLVQGAVVAGFSALMLGDVSSLLAVVPVVMSHAAYSRGFEFEADAERVGCMAAAD